MLFVTGWLLECHISGEHRVEELINIIILQTSLSVSDILDSLVGRSMCQLLVHPNNESRSILQATC